MSKKEMILGDKPSCSMDRFEQAKYDFRLAVGEIVITSICRRKLADCFKQ